MVAPSPSGRPRGRPRKHTTPDERRRAKNESQRKYKERKKAQGPGKFIRYDENNVDILSGSTRPSVSQPRMTNVLISSPTPTRTLGTLSLDPTIVHNSFFPYRPPERVGQMAAELEGSVVSLENRLVELREFSTEAEWASRGCQQSMKDFSSGFHEGRIALLQQATYDVLQLESECQTVSLRLSDLDPCLQHPLSGRCMLLLLAITRCRRILTQEKGLFVSGQLKDEFDKENLLWQVIWKQDNSEAVAEEEDMLPDEEVDVGEEVDEEDVESEEDVEDQDDTL